MIKPKRPKWLTKDRVEVGDNDLRRVNLPVEVVFLSSDKIIANDSDREYRTGYVMHVESNQQFIYNGEDSVFIGSIVGGCEGQDLNRASSVKFGRWLLKHAEPVWDSDFLCWMYDSKNLNTD